MRHARRAARAAAIALFAILVGAVASADVFHLTGQAHPRFHVSVSVNDTLVKEAVPSPDKPLVFLTQIDEGVVRPGRDDIEVSFERLPAEGRDDPPVPSFVIRVKRQLDPADTGTATELVEIRGPRRPHGEGAETGRLRTEFTVPE